ncbi:MAG: polysaccharide deacetylase family protein [Gemmataceae bacterium]|nr:polysaccharide deacetylase family protein [Gemmataceae bacterium]
MLAKLARRILTAPRRVPGYMRLIRRLQARSLAVVMYHGVTTAPLPVFNWCQLAVAEFARQAALLARAYTVLPLSEVAERLHREAPLPERTACLTFDDGFRNVLTTAYPILERHRLPATVFLVTGHMDTRQPAWPDRLFYALMTTPREEVCLDGVRWPLTTPGERATAYRGLTGRLKDLLVEEKDERLAALFAHLGRPEVPADSPLATLTWEEVAALRATGLVEFGSHTHTHPILARCGPERQEEELRRSRDVLRERLGRADLFAYPNGSLTPHTRTLLPRLGYRCGLTTVAGLNRQGQDVYGLRRVHVGADTPFGEFEVRLLGL